MTANAKRIVFTMGGRISSTESRTYQFLERKPPYHFGAYEEGDCKCAYGLEYPSSAIRLPICEYIWASRGCQVANPST